MTHAYHPEIFKQRRTGLLLHPTSLPSGRLGQDAYRFIDRLAECGVSLWQMLPLGPTHSDGSPYQCLSAHAGNPALIDRELLAHEWGEEGQASSLEAAESGFLARARPHLREAYAAFLETQAFWLEDYALFMALRQEQGGRAWYEWPAPLRAREPSAMREARMRLRRSIDQVRFEQFIFFYQWQKLKDYAHRKGIFLFGDVPIYVAHDSAEVWARPELFSVDAEGRAEDVAGVPPDYFSATGQRWGNPLYRWERHIAEGFAWWKARLATQLAMFDLIRIDHFRGLEAFWAIPAACETAIDGRWIKAPGDALLTALREHFGQLPLVAEDLGIITQEVVALRQRHGLPGMRILQFAFDGHPENPYLPHNHTVDSVVYTGTHDNDTTLGWWHRLDEATRQRVLAYLGHPHDPMPWPLIYAALESVASLVILPLQDVLGLGSEARMNTPGTTEGNWQWRFTWAQWDEACCQKLRQAIECYGRRA